jgi:thioredoxin reductase-like selenoprotein T
MRGYYVQIENFIRSEYPEFDMNNISGSTYPPTPTAELIASVTNTIWLFGIALLFGGSYLFKAFQLEEPKLYKMMKENQVASFVILFMMNSIGSSQLSTGAFEISVNDVVVFSKLQQGRLPNLTDIVDGLVSQGFRDISQKFSR